MLCLAGCLAACVTAVSATAARPASGQPATRVMTCNVRITGLPEDETAGRRWEDRRDACLKAIRMYRPDVICMQEVIYDSYNYFKEKFSDYVAYGFAGPEMDPYTEGYHFIGKNVIFFSKKRYEFVSSGCYWLSETPLAAGSCSWNTMRARHCNWVRLRDRKSGAEFRVLDIHLDHKSDDARREHRPTCGLRLEPMKKSFMLCLAGCLAACVTAVSATAARPASGQPATRVMTCNVRITGLPEDETAGRRWEDRRDACLKAIRMYRPDVICMQEVIYDSYNYFKEKFSDYVAYGFAGPEMDPYTEGYHFIGKNVIFFSKKRYEFVSSGCYWLSETPLAAGSCSWNTMRARHCNWVRLRDRKSGAEFRVLDIHLDHKSDDARREQMKMIVGECAQYADGFPQIICGDFNSGIENAPVACLRDAGWQEAYEAVHGPGEAGFTYHGFKGPDYRKKNARRIDFIFVRGNLRPVSAEILRDKVDGLYPSDHYFLMSDFIIQ